MNMKAIKNIKLIVILALATFVLDACVQDDDFQTPVIEIEEPDVTVNYTLQEIKDAIQANNGEPFIIQAESNDPVYVEAYVVSDDEAGNIYQKIYNLIHRRYLNIDCQSFFVIALIHFLKIHLLID